MQKYFDKNGLEIVKGCIIRYPNGIEMTVYETTEGLLGTDATNPKWIENGRAIPCEYGIFPLSKEDAETVEIVGYTTVG